MLLHGRPGCLRKVVIFHRVCGANAYVDRSSSLWGCHGSFSLTFPGCANKQLQTDGADDTANSLRFAPRRSGIQYRPKQTEMKRGNYLTLWSVYSTSCAESIKAEIRNSMNWIESMNYIIYIICVNAPYETKPK